MKPFIRFVLKASNVKLSFKEVQKLHFLYKDQVSILCVRVKKPDDAFPSYKSNFQFYTGAKVKFFVRKFDFYENAQFEFSRHNWLEKSILKGILCADQISHQLLSSSFSIAFFPMLIIVQLWSNTAYSLTGHGS